MSGEPIRLLDDANVRQELRARLAREAVARPSYDVERGLSRLRAAITSGAPEAPGGEGDEPSSRRLSVSSYAVKGSVWKVVGVVGLAALATVVGLRGGRGAEQPSVAGAGAPATVAPALGSDALEEADNLATIRAALPRDPASAFALAEVGHRRFSSGALYAEREACAVDALSLLGRKGEARERARRFLRDSPKSPLSERFKLVAEL